MGNISDFLEVKNHQKVTLPPPQKGNILLQNSFLNNNQNWVVLKI
jgi:hypothetical protein